MREINAAGLALTKQFEGFKDTAYQDQGGVWTIGYGHTHGVQGGMTCTPEQAEGWLKDDLSLASEYVEKLVKVALTDNQFAALADFAFNVGVGNFASSTLLRLLSFGRYSEVPDQLRRWNKCAGQVNEGLIRRREAEVALWNTADEDAS